MRWRQPSTAARVTAWLLGPAPRPWRVVSAGVLVFLAVSTSLRANWGSDNAFVVKAARTLLDGGSPYEDKRFLYLPSAVLVAVPEALLPREVLRWLLPAGMTGLLGAGWLAALRLFSVPLRSRLAGALVMPSPSLFFTKTLPFLFQGQDAYALPWDASPIAVLPRLGVPQPVAVAVAFAGAGAGLWAARARWRRPDPEGDGGELRLVETACGVMLAAFLVSRPSFDHYLLVVLPLLLASGVRAGSVPRSPWFWLALAPQAALVPWPDELAGKRRAFKDMATLCGLSGLLVRRALLSGRVILEPVTTAGSPPRTEPECAATPAESASRTAF
ncbi:hypothetical protein [Streptomyces sp. WAC07061]|uniref:hypothetical protein n=1 Tax=Streptomyces sp. WAC07061 TaxID=2487410 RepID=UPI0021AED24D|nr:hypothetical protein [Streptomyces sp. WAC07061]